MPRRGHSIISCVVSRRSESGRSSVAAYHLAEKQACEHALQEMPAPDFKSAVSSVRKEEAAAPSNLVSEETERAARATLSAAVAALAREVRAAPTPGQGRVGRARGHRAHRPQGLVEWVLERQVRRRGPFAGGAGLRRRRRERGALPDGRRLGRLW